MSIDTSRKDTFIWPDGVAFDGQPIYLTLGQIAVITGIPVSALAGLRGGSLVAVPREPTEAMLDRAGEVIVREFAESDWEEAKDMAEALNPRPIWDAMLAAAEPPR
jgi:hypothetical protein